VVIDPRQAHEVGVDADDEIGERASREVCGGDAVTYVTAGPRKTGVAIESDRTEPVARRAQRPAPRVSDPRVDRAREEMLQGALELGVRTGIPIERRVDTRTDVLKTAGVDRVGGCPAELFP
jgi:hypothetical protein